MKVEYRIVAPGSELHRQSLALREAALRRPLGRFYTDAEIARDGEGRHIVALWHGRVIGCAGLYAQGVDTLRLRHMAVLPALRGRGVGAGVLRYAEAWARAAGAAQLVTHARLTARGFYERGGYAAEGAPFDETGLPHILMRKTL